MPRGDSRQGLGSFAEAVAAEQHPLCPLCQTRHPMGDRKCIERMAKRREAEHRERIAEVKRYHQATGDEAAKGFLQMEAEDSCDLNDHRWKAWNVEGGSRRCREWLEAQA